MQRMKLFHGNANPDLAASVASYLGVPTGKATVKTFSDGEIQCEIEENVRGLDCFVVQSTCAPANRHLMELLIMVDALRRASARRITAVIPYYGYARQDRKVAPRMPITAKLVADLISTAGTDRVLCIDLHAGQIQGFFNIPVDNLYATPVLLPAIQSFGNEHLHHLARRRRRGARARLRQAPRRQARDHRQASRARERGRGHAHHRRRRGPRAA